MKKQTLTLAVMAGCLSASLCQIQANANTPAPNGKSWYSITASQTAGVADIYIYDEIGYWGITASDFARDLKALGDISQIHLHINSPGGSVYDGTAIYNLLKNHKAQVTTYIDGLAASMASVIAMAGNTIIMPENALMMIHNPWGGAVGDATEMRKMADLLDKIKGSLMSVYTSRTGLSEGEISAIMDAETWYTGAEAKATGFADETSSAVDLAASARWDFDKLGYAHTPNQLNRNTPSGRAAPSATPQTPQPKGETMKTKKVRDAQGNLVLAQVDDNDNIINILEILEPANKGDDEAAAKAAKAATQAWATAEKQRRDAIMGAFKGFEDNHRSTMDECLNDFDCTVETAQAKLLAALGSTQTPTARTHIASGRDETVVSKYRTDVVSALSARIGIEKPVAQNPMSGYTLFELARAALQMNGINAYGMSKMDIVATAFTHTTSDFGDLLSAVANKAMLKGYDEAEETFDRWTSVGELGDFKALSRLDIGAFPDLEIVPEGAEYKQATMSEHGEIVQLATYGRLFSITRQAIINDDLGAFTRVPKKMGSSARRTIGNLVYAILNNNPKMSDNKALFHADHGNLAGTPGGINTAAVDALRTLMRKQKMGSAHLNITPSFLLCGVENHGLATQTMEAEFEVGGSKSNNEPNYVRNIAEVISDPRLNAKAWHLAANPNVFDTIEVQYLDGIQTPTLEQQNGWNIDGTEFKVRIDAGVKALDYRGLAKNAGE